MPPAEPPGLPDPMDERFRWCVYCGADCWPDKEHQEHAADCPTVTGVWPVEPGSTCIRCEAALNGVARRVCVVEGDGRTFATAPVYEVVCEDCALAALVAGEAAQ